MGQGQVRIIQIELELVTNLTIRLERNSFHEAAFCLQLVTIIAIEFPSALIQRRDIGLEMPLMIESQNVVYPIGREIGIGIADLPGIRRFGDVDSKFRMIIPKR